MLVLGTLLATAGCGASKGTVSGSVSYKGENLKGGKVTFVNEKKETVGYSEIDENGKYSIAKVPAGEYTVCVETESFKPSPQMEMMIKSRPKEAQQGNDLASRAKRYKAIPAEYGDPEKSKLKVKVTGGKQEYNIPLS